MEYIGVGMEVDRRVAADSIRVRSWQEVLRYSAGDRGGRTLVQLDEDIAQCTAKQRGYNALPPADHVIHYMVDFAAEQGCDVIVYSMSDQDVVEEIVFLRRSEPSTQRPRGGNDALRQNAMLVSAPGQALRVAMTPQVSVLGPLGANGRQREPVVGFAF